MTFVPRPTIEDLDRWRVLVRQARRFAATPMAPAAPLTRAAKRAGVAIVPPPLSLDSPFVQLQRLATGWGLLLGPARLAQAVELQRLAALCADQLDDRQPTRRHRADVDG